MSEEKKYREWHLIDNQSVVIHGIGVRLAVDQQGKPVSNKEDVIHVIEYSAIEELEKKLEIAREIILNQNKELNLKARSRHNQVSAKQALEEINDNNTD